MWTQQYRVTSIRDAGLLVTTTFHPDNGEPCTRCRGGMLLAAMLHAEAELGFANNLNPVIFRFVYPLQFSSLTMAWKG